MYASNYGRLLIKRNYATTSNWKRTKRKLKANREVMSYLESKPNLKEMIEFIPEKYLRIKRISPPEHLYLIDNSIAKSVVKYVYPKIKKYDNDDHVICETNAGLGLITSELLEKGINLVRMYETCVLFRQGLRVIFLFFYFENSNSIFFSLRNSTNITQAVLNCSRGISLRSFVCLIKIN